MSRQNRHEQTPQTVTKTELNHQSVLIDLMAKLLDETRQNNQLLKEFLTGEKNTPRSPSRNNNYASVKKASTGIGFRPSNGRTLPLIQHPIHLEPLREQNSQMSGMNSDGKDAEKYQDQDIYRKTILNMESSMKDMAETNRLLFERLTTASIKHNEAQQLAKDPLLPVKEAEDLSVLNRQLQKLLKPKQERRNFGIITEIMPFSDKRQIKVRFRIMELLEEGKTNEALLMERTGEWVGMVFRATASICWNMLVNSILEYEEVKVLFTENIIFNFITFMNDTRNILDEDTRAKLTEHINDVACQSLQFLCKQYPQTRVEAPNIALRKSIPLIQNQGLAKFDLVAMVCRDGIQGQRSREEVRFDFRQDKQYAHIVMKTINYIIDKTEEQHPQFEKIMSNIFEKIYISKDKRGLPLAAGQLNTADSQYREKVIKYSSYIIGRKVPKNTAKYTPSEIESGVFFVKSPSVLRIVSKWLEQLWQFVNTPQEKLRSSTGQLKNHAGKALNGSSRVRNAIWEQVVDKLPKIQTKVERLKQQCFNMQLMLTGQNYTTDEKQLHLSEEQLGVGKFCSNLRDAVSSYVCAQLSKIIYYILLVPREVNETRLGFSNQEMQQQARKQLDQTNLVTLKIFDLLRCKCHSNQEQILWIVQALKKLEKEDPKFELVRVKDRLNQGTRDILINAQYDGGLVWEIQLAVTSHLDKKQDLLDKYNHFLYELKRTKLGPLSECVTIWATLEQRASYFQQLSLKKRPLRIPSPIIHKRKDCTIRDFSQFKRSTICQSCKQYDSIPINSLLNVRCQKCRVTYCGTCYYTSLSQMDKKKFMFQNFDKKKLMNAAAFHDLVEYTDFKQPFPKEGFFIRKKFLNRSLSYYTAVIIDYDCEDPDEFEISLAETIIRDNQIDSRCIHKNQIDIKVVDGEYYLKPPYNELKQFWFFYYKDKKSQLLTYRQLDEELRDYSKSKVRYLSLLFSPNYMSELRMIQKQFDKLRLLESLANVEGIYQLKFGVHRFPHFNVIAKVEVEEERLKKLLIQRENAGILMSFVEKKVTVINMEQCDLTDQLDNMSKFNTKDILFYFQRIQKVYLADNLIENIVYFDKLKNLQSLSISKNCLKSLKGVQNLTKLYYIKFDENKITSLVQLTNLINLTYVSGNSNLISNLKGMQKLEKLGSLSLCSNRIYSIDQLSNIPFLKRIYLRDNPITHIEPLSNTNIHHLFIGLTKINPIDIKRFNALGGLKEIALKELNIVTIPKIFEKMKNLISLKLSKNKIKCIENLQTLSELIDLDLSDNEIVVMQNLSALVSLQELKLKNNKIKIVTDVKTFVESLTILNLELNPLNDLQNYLMFEQRVIGMRLKYTEDMLTEQAKTQIRNHAIDINNKSESDD